QLTNLNVSGCNALKELDCSENLLTDLDISDNTALIYLNCCCNQLNKLDISNNTSLEYLTIASMPTLYEVCVWEGFNSNIADVLKSPNVCFQTDCNGDCSIVGIEENWHGSISIFPNPTNTLLTIKADISDKYLFEITAPNGQLLLSREMEGTTYQLDLSTFQKGVYIMTIRSKDFVTTRKIVKL
ncbi:MAG: T9SS type A sorting domain-containing protein, partial [Bacteroidales bacterium]